MARVLVDAPAAHLDRAFDYLVPAPMDASARPGVRVRVRFAGQDLDGWLLERAAASERPGDLLPLRRVVSPEVVLTPAVLALAERVAARYAGGLGDVLRLAVPPRHARAEKSLGEPAPPGPLPPPDHGPWSSCPAGPAFLHRLAAGEAPRAVWTALPGPDWTAALGAAVAAALQAGRGSVVVLPDHRDVDRLDVALTHALGPGRHVRLTADLGPYERYLAYLKALRGHVQVVIGTRAAAFAPVADLGLAVVWDDGDEQHRDPRTPYPHTREVLRLRAEAERAALLIAGWSRTVEATQLLTTGWARPIEADRATLRRRWARVAVGTDGPGDRHPGSTAARMPPTAWRAVHDGLAQGPVLVQVGRTGYLPGLSCQGCRAAARCPACAGPLQLAGAGGAPECRWCGRTVVGWACPTCAGTRLRATAVGVERTAEELGRAFPGARVVVSRADRDLPVVPPGRTLVLATAGIEPVVPGGYAAAVLLDGNAALERPDLWAAEDALRRWRGAAALVRGGDDGGRVVVCADPAAPAVQALVRSDPAGFAERELAERRELAFPPTVVAATVTGAPAPVRELLAALDLPPGGSVLGPTPLPGEEAVRALVRVPLEQGAALAHGLRAGVVARSARREVAVRVQVDPRDLG